jgi:hypothetical protein
VSSTSWGIGILAFGFSCSAAPDNGPFESVGVENSVAHVVELAGTVPPEFAADALITLAGAGLGRTDSSRQSWLSQAFTLAAGAQEETQLVAIGQSRASALTLALTDISRKGLDRISLQSRVVQLLAPLAPDMARKLYSRIALPDEPVLSCDAQFMARFVRYDDASKAVAETVRGQDDLRPFILERWARLKFAFELPGFVNLVTGTRPRLTTIDLASTSQAVVRKLPNVNRDSLLFENDLGAPLQALGQFIKMLPPGARSPVIAAAKTWVVNVSDQGMCRNWSPAPQNGSSRHHTAPLLPSQVFNTYIAPLSVSKADAFQGSPRLTHYVGTSSAEPGYLPEWAKYSRMLTLFSGGPNGTLAESYRWRRELQNCTRMVAAWRGDRQNQEYYLEKASILMRLIGLRQELPPETGDSESNTGAAPDPGDPATLLVQFLDGDVAAAIFRGRRAVWFAPVLTVLGSTGYDGKIDEELKVARNTVLRMYGELGELLRTVHRVYH